MYDFLLVAGVALWGCVLVWYLRQPAASAFHPVTYYLIFHGVLFTLRPILARLWEYDAIYGYMEFRPTAGEKAIVLLGADLALVTFVAVATWVGRDPFSLAPGADARDRAPRWTPSLVAAFALCTPLAVAALASSLSVQTTGASTMIVDARTGTFANTSTSGYFTDSILMLGPLAILFAWAGRFRWWSLLPLGLFVLAKAGTGGRWPFVMAVMSCGLYWMYARRLRWFPVRVVLGAVPLLLLFTAIGADRGAALRDFATGRTRTVAAQDYFQERPLESMDYGNMEFFEYIVHAVPGRTGTYDYFLNNLQLFTEPIPRVLWRGKPYGAPIKRFYLADQGNTLGFTLSVPGAGWFQAGWIGVALWAALYGWFYGWLYRFYVRSDQNRYLTALFVIMIPASLQAFRDGLLLTVIRTSFFPLLPLLVWRACRFLDRPAAGDRLAGSPA